MMRRSIIAVGLLLLAAFAAGQTLHVNDSATWREATEVHVNDAGTWREIQEVWVNDAGTWRQVFASETTTPITVTIGFVDDGMGGGAVYGYSVELGPLGSRSPTSYTDGISVSRTIDGLYFDNDAATYNFAINGAAVPNTDATFNRIVVNGTTYLRSAAGFSQQASRAYFSWTPVSAPHGTSGSINVDIVVRP